MNLYFCIAQPICLGKNSKENIDVSFEKLANMDSCFREKTIFFGEFHDVYALPEIKYGLITFLNTHYGHSELVMEIGFSAAFLYNKFLETGDTNYITKPKLPFGKTQPEMDFWFKLFDYNKSLSTENKFVIHGYDFERSELIKFLFLHLPNKEIPNELKSAIELIKEYKSTYFKSPNELKKVSKNIKMNFKKNEKICRNYFGENYITVAKVLENESQENNLNKRNKDMYTYLKKESYYISRKPFICFIGGAHIRKYDKHSLFNLVAYDYFQKRKPTTISQFIKAYQVSGFKAQAFAYDGIKGFNDLICNNLFLTLNNNCDFNLIDSRQIPLKNNYDFSDFILLMTDQKSEN